MRNLNRVEADLDNKQKSLVRKWSKPGETETPYTKTTKPISDHVFGNKTRIKIPTTVEHHFDKADNTVRDWLYRNTLYQANNDDYKKGVAYHLADDAKKRPFKIGRLLEQHKAPENIKKRYMNDPYRSASKNSHLDITVSRHPFDVAGMSTDRGWSSCLNLKGGLYKNKLKDEIAHGTHVAYLHHKSDPTISHPVARVALKPYHHKDETVLRPEQAVYGTPNPEFRKSVEHWSKQHFPIKPNRIYSKNKHIYNDDIDETQGQDQLLHHTDNSELFKHNSLKDIRNVEQDEQLKDLPVKYEDVEHHLPNINSTHKGIVDYIGYNSRPEDLKN